MILLYLYATLFLLKIVHEIGHLLAAKSCGIKCKEFKIGKGPKLFDIPIRQANLVFCLFPIGSKAVIQDIDDKVSVVKRIVVVLAGPFMNLLFAALLMITVAGVYKIYSTEPIIGKAIPYGSVKLQGIIPGDRVLLINNRSVSSWDDLNNEIQSNEDEKYQFTLERNGEMLTVDVVSFSKSELIESLSPIKTRSPVQAVNYELQMTYGYLESFYILATNDKSLDEDLSGPIRIRLTDVEPISYLKVGLTIATFHSNVIALFALLPIPPFDGWRLLVITFKGVFRRQSS